MNYEFVWVTTEDGIDLYGLLSPEKCAGVVINIHGTASNFYEMDFVSYFTQAFDKIGYSFLSTNNRGAYVLECYQKSGAAVEKFEDCLLDIDAWIEYAFSKGFKEIVLSGHSLGTEKVVYYMKKGEHRDKIKGVILLAPADSYGTQEHFLKENNVDLMKEAQELERKRRGEVFLTSLWKSHAGVLQKSANSYINFFSRNSELSKALPLRNGKDLAYYRAINVPILVAIGDQTEYTVIPIKDALALMKKENKLTTAYQLKKCTHDFEGKETELASIIVRFLKTLP